MKRTTTSRSLVVLYIPTFGRQETFSVLIRGRWELGVVVAGSIKLFAIMD
jgi:hypothetical protein